MASMRLEADSSINRLYEAVVDPNATVAGVSDREALFMMLTGNNMPNPTPTSVGMNDS